MKLNRYIGLLFNVKMIMSVKKGKYYTCKWRKCSPVQSHIFLFCLIKSKAS